VEPEVTRKQRPWALYALALVAAITVVAGVWGRVRNLGFPPRRMWDEIYFPVFARKYLDGVQFFDLHPPLGKFIMATSIAVFGDTPIGWRLMPAVFGCALILLGAVLGWYLTQEGVGALLTAAFFAGETIFVAYSRTGIMDGILVFFTLATFLAALWARRGRQVVWVAVLLGMAISIK
jgi:dolichyl-phosphate-mannose-protein mannosyltransferase